MTRAERIQHYREHIYGHVEGWVDPDMWRAIEAIGAVFDETGIYGDVMEFGVHHGLFLFLIDALRGDNAGAYAIGIWGDPELKYVTVQSPVDVSYWKDRQATALGQFEANAERFLPDRRFNVFVQDTLNMHAPILHNAVKFLSIDAGHDVENVIHDMSLAQEALVSGGIVALDDYMHPGWESVTRGYYRYMEFHNYRLRPVLYFRSKLFLTTISEHRGHVARLAEKMSDLCGVRKMYGYDCIVETKPRL